MGSEGRLRTIWIEFEGQSTLQTNQQVTQPPGGGKMERKASLWVNYRGQENGENFMCQRENA